MIGRLLSVLLVAFAVFCGGATAFCEEGQQHSSAPSAQNTSAPETSLSARLSGYREKSEDPQDLSSAGLRMTRSLAILLGVFFIGAFLWKKFGAKKFSSPVSTKRLQIIERLGLSPKTNLVLVRFDEKQLLLAVTDAQVTQINTESDVLTSADFAQVAEEECHVHARAV
jgi:flagellar protein FliO/FliZ